MKSTAEPVSFSLAFRIVAWKACVFADRRWELGPGYYCPTCLLPEKDVPNGCPRCPLAEAYESVFKAEAIKEIEARGGFPLNVTIDGLMEKHAAITLVLSDNRNRISGQWPVGFAHLARIIIEERAQQKFTRDWNDWQRAKDGK